MNPMKRLFAALLLVAISSVIQFSVVHGTAVDSPIRADAAKYVSYAYNLRNSGTFSHLPTWHPSHEGEPAVPDKLTLPGYPAVISLFLRGEPDQDFLSRVTLFQAALGVLSVLLVYAIASRLLPWGWAFTVGLVTAINPHLATISTYILTESLFTTLLLASVLATLLAVQNNRIRLYIIAGFLLGATSLVRPQLQILPFVLAGLALVLPAFKHHARGAILGLICFLSVLSPWLIRNATTEKPAGAPSLLVNTIYHGSFPNMMYKDDPRTYGFAYRFDPDMESASRNLSSALKHLATQVREDPLRYAQWYLIGKPGFFLSWGLIAGGGDIYVYPTPVSPYRSSGFFKALKEAAFLLHWPLMLLAVLSAFLTLRGISSPTVNSLRAGEALLALIFLYAIALHMLGAPYPRYGIPFRPLAYVLAFCLAHRLWLWKQARTELQKNASAQIPEVRD